MPKGNHTNYTNTLYKEYEKSQKENEDLQDKLKYALLRADIAEDEQRRLEKQLKKLLDMIDKYETELSEKDSIIRELKRENERLQVIQNNDGTIAGIPTSKTPIGKKKVIPNFAKKTGEPIGRKKGHKKDKLERIPDDQINNKVEHTLESCPKCEAKGLVDTGKVITKDEKDYRIIVKNTRHYYKVYKCPCCGKEVHEEIPNKLKEDCQYGDTVKILSLTLSNVGNVPLNKIRRILSGLSINEINPCEGYLAKLQRKASKATLPFLNELRDYIINSKLVCWDDTVIMVNTHQACMRYYGNDNVCLFKAHEKKNMDGLDKDNILNVLPKTSIVEHDHNKVNYNDKYSFENAECCQHLLRDLKKVKTNIPSRTWSDEMSELFRSFDHKRNILMSQNIDTFTSDEINDFILKVDEFILLGLDENEKDPKPYYAKDELTLLNRIMEYRDNYLYWILDFDIPFTNNISERNLRGVKSKMKISGQFQNINRAEDYANIRSYIETCRLYGVNEYECLSRLVNDNPYTLKELLDIKK